MEKIGMDAVVFLRFTRMLRNMFLVLGLIGLCVMIPVNVAMGNKAISNGLSAFSIMTPLFVFGDGLWAQVVVAWIIDMVVAYFLWHNYRRIHSLRRAYFQSDDYQKSLHARTVMLRDLPKKARTDEGIMRVTDEINPTGVQPRTAVGRNVQVLPDLIEEHGESVRELESVLAKYLKNPDRLPTNRPTMRAPRRHKGQKVNGRVDAIEYLTERIKELELEINEIRERVDKRDAMSYGFASWEQIQEAHSVAFAARKKKIQGATIKLAPRPNDLIWENVPLTKAARKRKRFMAGVWITVLTVLWTPLNAGIAIFLSNLSNLGSVWPAFQLQLQAHRTLWSIVQGIASPAITSLVYLVLPIIFRRLQIRAGDYTKTARERHVLRNLYAFFTLNNLIVFSLFSAIWQYITLVIQKSETDGNAWDAIVSGQFFLTITTALCQISPFWLTWLLQRNLGAAIDLAQLWSLFYVWFAQTFLAPTPRQNIEWTAPPAFNYASYYNYFLFYSTVALCFSTLQPIILIITALYFSVDSLLKKYLLMYVFITKTESGGQFWRTLFNRLIFAVILSNVIIGVVVKARGTWTMVFAMVPLIILMLGFKWYCAKTFDKDMTYYATTGMQDTERLTSTDKLRRAERIAHKFGHPALYKPLVTPMVHARARHVLQQLYHGRLNSDVGQTTDFSDLAMQPMTQGHKPAQDAPFEIVPEAQQDFEYYMNRSDFRDEIGGGDLYGKPDDLITERSHTPMSFMGKDYQATSPSSSRASSPAPSQTHRSPRMPPHAQMAHEQITVHPAFRSGSNSDSGNNSRDHSITREGFTRHAPPGGLSVPHGPYTDPYDDRTNLLRGAGELRTPNGEFMNVDRWRTNASTPNQHEDESGSYDYFRGRR